MVRLSLTALAVCLFLPAAELQGFTIQIEHSSINVTVGRNAFFSVRPSAETKSGNWVFKDKTLAQWVGTGVSIDNEYTTRVELFLPNGSLQLNSVTVSDSGEYTVTMFPKTGAPTTATITLHVLAISNETNGDNNISSGAIAGIVIAVLVGVALISGISAWLVKRKAGRMKDRARGQNDRKITATVNDISATIGENSAGTYENIPRKQKERATKPLDDNSTYMGLQLQDQSVYSDLVRH
ncbi:V-set and transmembrane domain-containing protein 5-like [Heptranchias perlo]|uniref:V-set and transmembrane domain-containing protein 5-like n=1 Tax=Heptranchias perlo TaxID=212740 RepID=UPI00355A06DC